MAAAVKSITRMKRAAAAHNAPAATKQLSPIITFISED